MSYHQAMVVPLSPILESMVQGELCHPSLPISNVTISLDMVNPTILNALMDLVYTGKSAIDLSQNSSEIQELVHMLGLEMDLQFDKPKKGVVENSVFSSTDDVIESKNMMHTNELLDETISAPKRRTSRAWNYFSLQEDHSARCNLCQKSVKRKTGNTHGMLRHLRTHHGSFIDEPEAEKRDNASTSTNVTLDEIDTAKELNESISNASAALDNQIKEFEVKTSDLKEFANKKLAEKLEAKSSKNSSRAKQPPVELYDSSHYIWGYYTPLENAKAKCLTCSRDISRSMGKNDFMVKHMSFFHPEVYIEYISKRSKKSSVLNLNASKSHGSSESLNESSNSSLSFEISNNSSVQNLNTSKRPESPESLNISSSLETPNKVLPIDDAKERKRLLSELLPSVADQKQKPSKKKRSAAAESKEGKCENNEMEEVFLNCLKDDLDEFGDDLRFQSGKKKISVIWNFFSEVDSDETKDVNAKCNFCCSEVSRPHGTTSKLRDHLRKHRLIFKEFQRIKDLRKQAGSDLDTTQESVLVDGAIQLG